MRMVAMTSKCSNVLLEWRFTNIISFRHRKRLLLGLSASSTFVSKQHYSQRPLPRHYLFRLRFRELTIFEMFLNNKI